MIRRKNFEASELASGETATESQPKELAEVSAPARTARLVKQIFKHWEQSLHPEVTPDWKELSYPANHDSFWDLAEAKVIQGTFTLNPNMLSRSIDTSKLQFKHPPLVSSEPMHAALHYMMKNYAQRFDLPGLESVDVIQKELTKSPVSGQTFLLPGTLVAIPDGRWAVLGMEWQKDAEEWHWIAFPLNEPWNCPTVVLVPKEG